MTGASNHKGADTEAEGNLRVFLQVADALNSGESFQEQLAAVLEIVTEALDADAATVCVPVSGEGRHDLRIAFAARGEQMRTALLQIELGLREQVLRSGVSLSIADVRQEAAFRGQLEGAFGYEPRALLAVPLHRRQQVIGFVVAVRVEPRAFSERDQALLEAVADKVAIAVENDSLVRQLRRELQEHELLLDISRKVGKRLDLDRVLEQIFDALHPVVPYDAAAIFLLDPRDESLQLSAQRGYADEARILEVPAGKGLVGVALNELHGVRIGDARNHPSYLAARPETRAEMAVPIISAGEAIGVINLESDEPDAYSERDQRLAELIAAQVASAITIARRHRDRIERSQVEAELALARDIQQGLFPAAPPPTPAVDWGALNIPSSAVGGDYYDYLLTDDNRLWLLIADVSGHGLSAALLTASMRTGFQLLVRETRRPHEVAERLNEVLYEGSPANQFVAAVISILDLETGDLRSCNAGHIPPLIIGKNRTLELVGGGLPLGMFPDARYESRRTRVEPGDLLVYYTDGIPEATDRCGEEFGIEPLARAVRAHRLLPIPEIIEGVRQQVRAHRGRTGGHLDDITLMVTRRRSDASPS